MYLPIHNQFEPLEAPEYLELSCLLSLCRDAANFITHTSDTFEESFDCDPHLLELCNISREAIIQTAQDSAHCLELLEEATL